MQKILLVEDEVSIARFVELELTHEGYAVTKAEDGRQGLALAEGNGFDLVLLDIMLPGLNGLEVLRRLRKTSDVPVIMLTARDAVMDKVTGLDMGADDYITKPFSIEELLARIRTALRRKNAQALPQLVIGPLVLDVARHTLTVAGENVDLTGREFSLLQVLMENKDIVLTRDVLMERVWGYDYLGETNVVDVYIRYLRAKIGEKAGQQLIHTVRGLGYVVREEI
ncbi:MAG: response regulator transcription factor [Clostridiales bacterium]|jgi:DNA-binding response OmpR family regulator|nr:response regulator transcription factor [Clostridiales bacterium]